MSNAEDDPLEAQEFELDSEDAQNLEEAMREALEAVEHIHEEIEPEVDAALPQPGVEPESEIPSAGDEAVAVDAVENEKVDLRDRLVRTLADFDNFRKRIDREREEQQRFAGAEVLRHLLPIVDNLERALEADGQLEDLKAGVELILRQLGDLLRRHGVKRIKSTGELFDPARHEAVSRHEEPGVEAPTVTRELQAGYHMKERLLRPSMVVVAVPPDPGHTPDDEGGGKVGS